MFMIAYLGASVMAIGATYWLLLRLGHGDKKILADEDMVKRVLIEENIKTPVDKIALSADHHSALIRLSNGDLLLLQAVGHFWHVRSFEQSAATQSNERLHLPASGLTDPTFDFVFQTVDAATDWQHTIQNFAGANP